MILINRGHRVADRQRRQLLEAVIKEGVSANNQRASTGSAKSREGFFQFCVVADVQNIELDSEFQGGRLRVAFHHRGQWIFWIDEQANTGGLRDQFLSELHPFRRDFTGHLRYASDIRAGPAQARDQSELDWIAASRENNRDRSR